MYKALLVDDEPAILEGLLNIIDWNEIGVYIVGTAKNGIEALELIEQKKIDILITDIIMPEMNGLELIKKVKELDKDVKFIILSGYNDFEYVKEGILLGIENYLLKPINTEELKLTILNVIEKLNSKNELLLINKDLDILRNNILYRWVNNNIGILELKERAEFINIDIYSSNFIVSIINIKDKLEDNGEISSEKIDKVISYFNSFFYDKGIKYTIFSDIKGDIIAIYYGSELRAEAIKELSKEINKRLSINDISTFISIGSKQNAFFDVYKSYFDALKLQEHCILFGYNNVISIDDVNNVEDNFYYQIDTNYLYEVINKKDKQLYTKFIEDFYSNIISKKVSKPDIIYNTAIEIIFILNNILKQHNIKIETGKYDYKDMFIKIFQIDSIDKLKSYLINLGENIIDNIELEKNYSNPIIKDVLNYISNNFYKELSLKTISQRFSVNSAYLGRIFQKETGLYFNDYINKYRISKAQHLILNTHYKISEIAEKVGYTDTTYFCKLFKKYYGISPAEMRNLKAQK